MLPVAGGHDVDNVAVDQASLTIDANRIAGRGMSSVRRLTLEISLAPRSNTVGA